MRRCRTGGTIAALTRRAPLLGIIYLKPGHISPTFVLEMIAAIEASSADADLLFMLVAERTDALVLIRVRGIAGAH